MDFFDWSAFSDTGARYNNSSQVYAVHACHRVVFFGDSIYEALRKYRFWNSCPHRSAQVLDEIGVSFGDNVPEAPTTGMAQGGAADAEAARQPVATAEGGGGGGDGGGSNPPAGGAAGGDANMSELEIRLNNLRRGS